MLHQLAPQELLEVSTDALQPWHTVHDIAGQMEAVELVEHGHIERSRGCAFFFVTAYMEIVVIGTAIGQAMNQPRITVIRKNDRLILRENRIKVAICQAMRMLGRGLNGH